MPPDVQKALSDVAIRKLKPTGKMARIFDGGGLYIEISPSGSKWWRLKYRYAGKEKRLALGVFPEVGLATARARRDEARRQLANGTDPGEIKRAQKIQEREAAAETFGALAGEWIEKKSPGLAPATIKKKSEILRNNLLPWLAHRPVKEIQAPELLGVIRRVESRGANELAHRALNVASQIMRYAVVTGRAERDPAADLRGALTPVNGGNHAALTDPNKVGGLMRAINGFDGTLIVRCALRLSPFVFVRPGELRSAEWSEIDLDRAEWIIPAAKMKMRRPHVVPLASQAVEILRELHPLTGAGRYVFPSLRTSEKPFSENTLNAALRRCGFSQDEMTAHGFRAMARTILDEVLGFRLDLIEHQLAHAVKDPNGRAYNRTAHLPERRKMMQMWADYLDKLRTGADVIGFEEARRAA